MESPIVPQYIWDRGVVSIERVGHSSMRCSWKVDTSNMESRILRNTMMEKSEISVYRDRIVSTFDLGEYGPPAYEYSSMESREGQLILVEVRSYMPGATLEEVSPFMSDQEANDISMQIKEMISAHGSVVSPVYGAIGDPETADERLVNHMREVRSFHICTGGKRCCIRKLRTPRGEGQPRLCHNNLTPDHIIVHSGRIVSVIGWSHCDFSAMQLQAASYAYRMDLSGETEKWLGEITCSMLNMFSGKRDRLSAFCAAMHMCRLSGGRSAPWLESIIGDAN